MNCSHEHFLSNLIEANKRAQVAPEVVDLIAAYARLCLKQGIEPKFYEENPVVSSKKITIKNFIARNAHLDKRSLSFLVSYAEMMRDKGLPFLFSKAHLAGFLDLKPDKLQEIIDRKNSFYRTFHIPKSNGSARRISAPEGDLKVVQRSILRTILERVPLHPSSNGFKKGKSILSNAENHVGQEIVIKMDIKDFFPSITLERIKGVYLNLGYPEGVASVLAELSTHKGRLPMGAPTSPYLSNIIASRLDRRFTNLGKKRDFTYSRYADDLAFSSQNEQFSQNISFFRKIIRDEGFEVNEKKVVIARKGGRQKITGVVVNRKMNVVKAEYKKLRAVVYNCVNGEVTQEIKKWGASRTDEFKNILSGHINFVKMVNDDKGTRLLDQFNKISWPA